MTRHSRLTGISGSVSATRNSSFRWCLRAWPQHDADVSAGSLEWLSTRHRIPLLRADDQAERSAFRLPREKPDYGDRRTGRAGMRNGRGFRIRSSLPRLPWFRPGPAACHARRAAGKLAALRAGASSDRPVEGHHGRWRKVRVRWPAAIVATMATQRRPQEGSVWCTPVPADLGGCWRNSREAAARPCCEARILARAAWCPFYCR